MLWELFRNFSWFPCVVFFFFFFFSLQKTYQTAEINMNLISFFIQLFLVQILGIIISLQSSKYSYF